MSSSRPSLLIAAFLVIAALVRIHQFAGIEPRMDQAFSMQWIQSLRAAEHFWPVTAGRDSFLTALATDDKSWLHALLRPIHAVSKLILTLGAQFWFYLGSFFAGADSEGQKALSIVTQAAAIGVLGAIGFSAAGGGSALAVLTVLLASASSFLHVFSPLGAHNVALLALMAALWAFERLFGAAATPEGPSRATLALAFGMQAVALYTYFSILFILPAAVFLALIADGRISQSRRFRLIVLHGSATAAALLPFAGVVAWEIWAKDGTENQSFLYFLKLAWQPTEPGGNFAPAAALEWFRLNAETFSAPGLILGLGGLLWLARRGRCSLPLAVVIVHFGVWMALPQFRQYDRTIVYSLPFLTLGVAAALVAAWRSRNFPLRAAAAGLLFGHAAIDWPRLSAPEKVAAWGHDYRARGSFRALMRQVHAVIPAGATLMLPNYDLTHRWRALSYSLVSAPRIASPLETVLARPLESASFLPPTGVRRNEPLFLLLPEREEPDTAALSRITCDEDARPCGRAIVERLSAWTDPRHQDGIMALYRVRWSAAGG